jgi:hypothetical protein
MDTIEIDFFTLQCGECGRFFDMLDYAEAAEWEFGHDCGANDDEDNLLP